MKSRPKILLVSSMMILLTGCAGTQWETQTVSGSRGPVMEIRTARPESAVSASPVAVRHSTAKVSQSAISQIDIQPKQDRIREELLKQTAITMRPNFTDYRVGPEDLLQINFLDAEKLSTEARVNGQGEIRLLLVGDVQVGGLSTVEITRKLETLYKRGDYLRNPQITVAVKDYRHQKVAVTGAVNKPDYYALIGPRTLLEVLGMSGGLSDKAGEVVHIIRPADIMKSAQLASSEKLSVSDADTIVVDLNRLVLDGEVSLNYTIKNGDVVFVPFAQSAFVLGAITKPGNVILKDNMTVTKAVAQTGGINLVIGSYRATIVRIDEGGQRLTIPVDLSQITKGRAEDIPLKENDVVFVHESAARRFMFDIKSFFPGSVGLTPPLF